MKKGIAILYAALAAAFYAINMPFSKLLLGHIPSTILAGLLYLGAGLGVGERFPGAGYADLELEHSHPA